MSCARSQTHPYSKLAIAGTIVGTAPATCSRSLSGGYDHHTPAHNSGVLLLGFRECSVFNLLRVCEGCFGNPAFETCGFWVGGVPCKFCGKSSCEMSGIEEDWCEGCQERHHKDCDVPKCSACCSAGNWTGCWPSDCETDPEDEDQISGCICPPLRNSSEEVQSNKKDVLVEVRKNGFALRYASSELRKDKDVVIEAVAQNFNALKYAHKDLRYGGLKAFMAESFRAHDSFMIFLLAARSMTPTIRNVTPPPGGAAYLPIRPRTEEGSCVLLKLNRLGDGDASAGAAIKRSIATFLGAPTGAGWLVMHAAATKLELKSELLWKARRERELLWKARREKRELEISYHTH